MLACAGRWRWRVRLCRTYVLGSVCGISWTRSAGSLVTPSLVIKCVLCREVENAVEVEMPGLAAPDEGAGMQAIGSAFHARVSSLLQRLETRAGNVIHYCGAASLLASEICIGIRGFTPTTSHV